MSLGTYQGDCSTDEDELSLRGCCELTKSEDIGRRKHNEVVREPGLSTEGEQWPCEYVGEELLMVARPQLTDCLRHLPPDIDITEVNS